MIKKRIFFQNAEETLETSVKSKEELNQNKESQSSEIETEAVNQQQNIDEHSDNDQSGHNSDNTIPSVKVCAIENLTSIADDVVDIENIEFEMAENIDNSKVIVKSEQVAISNVKVELLKERI